jgi:hypothetical protein
MWFGFLVLILWTSFIFADKAGSLPDLGKPGMIVVNGNELYVAEGCNFSVYSLNTLEKLRQFGKKGEGPGELLEIPHFPNKITVLKDRVFVTGIGKAISFTKNGDFKKEFRTHQRVFQLIPVGKNFVAKELGQGKDKKTRITMVTLYNSNMEKIKELYRQDWVRQGAVQGGSIDMGLDFTGFVVADDKIFVEQSPDGFLINVFDSNGNKLYHIKRDYEKQPITSEEIERLENMMKNDPAVKEDMKAFGGWKALKKMMRFNYPDYYAPIKGIEISGGKLYVRTFKLKGDKEEYLVMDLKGNLLKKAYISRDLETGILAQVAGSKLYSIFNDKLYYLVENEDEEEWELHVESL